MLINRRPNFILLPALLLSSAAAAAQPIPEELTAKREIPESRVQDALLTAKRCTSCHNMKRVTRARYVGDEWEICVEEMREKEKSGISARDATRITGFLAWWSTGEDPQPEPVAAEEVVENPFKAPLKSILASAAVAADSAGETRVTLGDMTVSVTDLKARWVADGAASASATIRLGEQDHPVSHERSATGSLQVTGATTRTWQVGPFQFAHVVHIVSVEPGADGQAPRVRFAAVVERRDWKHRKIGWHPRGREKKKATPPKPDPKVCPVDH